MAHILSYSSSKIAFGSPKWETKVVKPYTMMRKLNMRPLQCVLEQDKRRAVVKNGRDSLDICRLVNGMWQTKGEWCAIDHDNAVDAMLRYADAGLTAFDMADIYGPAEDLYGIFINRVRRERPPEYLDKIRGWDDSNPGYLDALKHLTDLKEEGKIKTLALTNFDTERLQIILENEITVVSNQVQHSIVDMRPQQKIVELCQLKMVLLIVLSRKQGIENRKRDEPSASPTSKRWFF